MRPKTCFLWMLAAALLVACGDNSSGGSGDDTGAHDVGDDLSDAGDVDHDTLPSDTIDDVDDVEGDAADTIDEADDTDIDVSDVDADDASDDTADISDDADTAPDVVGPECGDDRCDDTERAGDCAADCAIVAIDAGAAHTCVVHAAGEVSCWGSSDSLRAGGAGDFNVATRIPGLDEVTAIAAGDEHTCVLRGDGEVWCWGSNGFGQLGSDDVSDWAWPPKRVADLDGYTRIAAGGSTTCVWGNVDRLTRCWGQSDAGQTGRPGWVRRLTAPLLHGVSVDTQSVAIGEGHACERVSSGGGSMSCFGRNAHGQLGTGDRVWRNIPTRIFTTTSTASAFGVGDNHTCAIYPALVGNSVACWGNNALGQLGGRTGDDALDARAVSGASPAGSIIDAGANHTCIVIEAERGEDAVRCWGDNSSSQCGVTPLRPTDNPLPVAGTAGATRLAAGDAFTCATIGDDRVVCWGSNRRGQLGTRIGLDPTSSSAVRVGGI